MPVGPIGYRTPRKQKVWADRYPGQAQADGTAQVSDLLSEYKSNIDLTRTQALTAMRIIGRIETLEDGAASTPAHGRVQVGIAWMPADFSASSATVFGHGIREFEWLWRDTVLYAENSSVVAGRGCATVPPERNSLQVDIRQMRKQPTPRHNLNFVWKTDGADEGTTIDIRFHFQTLLALP